MASGAAAPVKMSTAVTACILLAVLLPMAPKLVMGDCSGSCVTLCDTFADGFCTGQPRHLSTGSAGRMQAHGFHRVYH
ncbi:hypothetical protein Zm00014a_040134 [Zea mays]|jgi:hypothetical protein|uniref:Uncharacterized protein n=1 Tax=Zea mays TaxID=4577 RepID=A0A3L6DRL1_MAIZE|nr:hypothetical protein Zm00014a_040134 [Zea mays]